MKVQSIERFSFETVEDFIKLKKESYFNEIRQQAKTVGLAFIFARGAISFAIRDLQKTWTSEQADVFIQTYDLEQKLDTLIARQKDYTLFQAKLIVCATYIRDQFFKTYPGLMDRIKANREFAKEHGYVRSVYGAMRRLPEYLLTGSDDRAQFGDIFANLDNVAANTDIQNFESVSMNRPIAIIDEWLVENNMKSYFISQVHDAEYLVVHRSEIDVVYNKVRDEMEKWYPEYWELGLVAEEKIGDPKLGHFYGSGISYKKYLEKIKK